MASNLLTNFYNYILHHDVCPEYRNDILAARAICQVAVDELPKVVQVREMLPGSFNIAISTLTNGRYSGINSLGQSWTEHSSWQANGVDMTNEQARVILFTGLCAFADEKVVDTIDNAGSIDDWLPRIIPMEEKSDLGFEVAEIRRPDQEVLDLYKEQQKLVKDRDVDLTPLGTVICKSWSVPSLVEYDLPK